MWHLWRLPGIYKHYNSDNINKTIINVVEATPVYSKEIKLYLDSR